MTWLVTGGAGFIGSHLVDALLASGARVRVLDDLSTGHRANLDPRAELVVADVADAGAASAAMDGVDGCFHLAAIASVARANEDWAGTHRVNLGGTIAVLNAARLHGVPVVYASSAAVYGAREGVACEQAPTAPMSAYGADKLGSELHARAGAVVHGLRSVGLRFFNVYGPRQDPKSPYSGVISIFAAAIAAGRAVTVHGDGLQTRDFIYVGDLVLFLEAAMRHAAQQETQQALVLNACTGRETSVLDLIGTIGGLSGVAPAVRHGPARPGDIRRSLGDPALAATILGVTAATLLPHGLAETLRSLANPAAAPKTAAKPVPAPNPALERA